MPSQFCQVDPIGQSFDRFEGFRSQFPLSFPGQRESSNGLCLECSDYTLAFNVSGIEMVTWKVAGGANSAHAAESACLRHFLTNPLRKESQIQASNLETKNKLEEIEER